MPEQDDVAYLYVPSGSCAVDAYENASFATVNKYLSPGLFLLITEKLNAIFEGDDQAAVAKLALRCEKVQAPCAHLLNDMGSADYSIVGYSSAAGGYEVYLSGSGQGLILLLDIRNTGVEILSVGFIIE